MDKSTQTFIDNAGKATQKKEVWFDAYKPTGDDFRFDLLFLFEYGLKWAIAGVCLFAWWLV